MADDLLSAIQVGANIGNMRVQRQERMMQLRAQAALQAVHERQLAAQADMLAQHAQLYHEQAQREQAAQQQKAAVLRAGQDLFEKAKGEGKTDEEAMGSVIAPMSLVDPKTASDLALSYSRVVKAKTAGQPTPHQQALEDLAQKRLDLATQTQTRLTGREKRLDAAEQRRAAGAAVSEEVKQLNKQIDSLQRQHDKLVPETGDVKEHPVTLQRMALRGQIRTLRERAMALKQGTSAPLKPKAPEGEVLVRDKAGKLGSVPKEDLEDALKEGYTLEEAGAAASGGGGEQESPEEDAGEEEEE